MRLVQRSGRMRANQLLISAGKCGDLAALLGLVAQKAWVEILVCVCRYHPPSVRVTLAVSRAARAAPDAIAAESSHNRFGSAKTRSSRSVRIHLCRETQFA